MFQTSEMVAWETWDGEVMEWSVTAVTHKKSHS